MVALKGIKAILVNTKEKKIEEVYLSYNPKERTKQIQEYVEGLFTLVRLNRSGTEYLFVDDEGLLKEDDRGFFVIISYPSKLKGNGIIVGCDEEGETVDTELHVEQVEMFTKFL